MNINFLEKLKNPFVVVGISTIAATSILVTMLWNQGVINNQNGNIDIEKNNIPIYKEYKKWVDNLKEILKNPVSKSEYKENIIDKNYTLISNGSFQTIINNDNKDLMITFDENDMFKRNLIIPRVFITEFDMRNLLTDNTKFVEVPSIKGGYKYFNNNWYIDNYYLTKQTKDESIIEINKIINAVNKYIETQNQIKNSWSK